MGPSYESKVAQAWSCGLCAKVYADKKEADSCCTCSNCGEKFVADYYGSTCDSCLYRGRLRYARDDLERKTGELRSALNHLRGMIENPPKGKKRPKTGIAGLAEVEQLLTDAEREVAKAGDEE